MSEPTTVLTDYALAAVALAIAFRLARPAARPSAPALLWAASFVALAVAALVGGTWHGIPAQTLPALRGSLWSATYVAIGLADLLLLAGAAWEALGHGVVQGALALLGARFGAYAVLVVDSRDFRLAAVEFAATLALLAVFGLDLARRREHAAAFVLGGVAVSLAGGLVLSSGLGLHERFNNNDLYHVIQAFGLWLFFRGARLLRPRASAAAAAHA
jgi:hypothetical protein